MNYNLVVHVDLDEEKILNIALVNISNYLTALPMHDFEVVMVVNGPAVQLFTTQTSPVAPVIAQLAEKGVSFRLCANALRKFQLAPEAMLTQCTVVPAGIVEIVHLQNQGFAYIKP